MNRFKMVLLAALGILGAPVVAHADPIDVAGGGSFTAFPSPIGGFGSPFWNGKSSDQPNGYSDGKAGVGYYLTGTGDFSTGNKMGSPGLSPSVLKQYTNGGAGPVSESFTTAAGVSTQLYVTIAGNAATNVFGWYDAGGKHALFSGSGSATFTPVGGSFGLYLDTASYGTFYSESNLNPSGSQTDQHFAVFKQTDTGTLWIGVEDLPFYDQSGKPVSDRDYNDVVVSLTAVPEPTSIAGFCLGGLVVGAYRLTRRKAKA